LNDPRARDVADVPQPPEGPLQPTDVTKSSCALKWNPPADDGGSEITHYAVEKMDSDTLRWVPVGDSAGTSTRCLIAAVFGRRRLWFSCDGSLLMTLSDRFPAGSII